ncbi:MAG: TonB-dependent receptor [Pseudomonadota bacterium]
MTVPRHMSALFPPPLWTLLLCTILPAAAFGEAVEETSADAIEEVTVQAARLRFGVEGTLEPEVSYDAASIRSLAVGSLAELLDELAPDLDSGRGRSSGPPVVLINGERVGGFREVRDFPPEAIARVEIYPEEVALRFGYRADQKVINFVLRPRFRATTLRLNSGVSHAGGAETTELQAGYLRMRNRARTNLTLRVLDEQALHESDRSVPLTESIRPFGATGNVFATPELDPLLSALVGGPVSAAALPQDTSALTLSQLVAGADRPARLDDRPLRTLVAARDQWALNAGYARGLAGGMTLTLSGDYQHTDTAAQRGALTSIYTVSGTHPRSPFTVPVEVRRGYGVPLDRDQTTSDLALSGRLDGRVRDWSFNWINRYDRIERDTHTQRGADLSGFVTAIDTLAPRIDPFAGPGLLALLGEADRTLSREWSSQLLVRGVLAEMRAGAAHGSASISWTDSDRRSSFASGDLSRRTGLQRETGRASFNLDLPLLDSRSLGQLALNGNLERTHHSDMGSLELFGAGLTWRPLPSFRLTSSWTREQGAPSSEDLADALTRSVNRRVYDVSSGFTTDAVVLAGGNPDLRADTRRVLSLGVRLEPFDRHDLSLSINWVDSRTDNPVQRFTNPSPDLELAFAERFVRDPEGRLIELDARPVNGFEARRRELRWGLRYSRRLDTAPRLGATRSRPANVRRPEGTARAATRGLRGRGARGGRLRLSVHHVLTLRDEVALAPGLAALDYVGINNGVRPRGGAEHEVTVRGGMTYRGFATRFSVIWQDATRSLPGAAGRLSYDARTRIDLAVLYSFHPRSRWVQRWPALQASRLRLSVRNLLDDPPTVRDARGGVVAGLTEDELDPRGRTVALELRKLLR